MGELSPDHLLEIVDRVGEGVLLLDPEMQVLHWNDTLVRWSGVPREDAVGRPLGLIWDEADPGVAELVHSVREALQFGMAALHSPALHLGPLPLRVEDSGHLRQRVLVEPLANACLVRVEDASEVLEREARLAEQDQKLEQQRRALLEQERRMHQVAHFDPITGLANRGQLRRFLDRMVARPLQAYGAVVRLALDDWTAVNQRFNADFGDRLLRRCGARLEREVRPIDVVGRTDGDEFMIVLDDVDGRGAEAMVGRMLESLRRPCVIDGQEVRLTGSGGIALYPDHGAQPEDLMRRAQLALFESRRHGRDRFRVFNPNMDRDHQERVELLGALQRATHRMEFQLNYQPQLRLKDSKVVGAEALLRWKRNEAFVRPDHFVPILEESGLIVPVGLWVVAEAVEQAVAWRDAGTPIRVAVNVSAQQLAEGDFVSYVAQQLEHWKLQPELFEVELTESLLVEDVTSCRAQLRALRSLGVSVAIDDFGTGYSSLAHLRRFPVDVLKIDRTFTQEVHEADGQAIVRTIIGLGRTLELEVLAEGVETEDQVRFLRDEGCHSIQGFGLARPMPPDQCGSWLADFRA